MDFKSIENKIKMFKKAQPTFWGCALCGEAGEAANVLKKIERQYFSRDKSILVLESKLSEELADVFIYATLTARHFSIDFEAAILKKIDKVNNRQIINGHKNK